jgi:hypothetical protein
MNRMKSLWLYLAVLVLLAPVAAWAGDSSVDEQISRVTNSGYFLESENGMTFYHNNYRSYYEMSESASFTFLVNASYVFTGVSNHWVDFTESENTRNISRVYRIVIRYEAANASYPCTATMDLSWMSDVNEDFYHNCSESELGEYFGAKVRNNTTTDNDSQEEADGEDFDGE